MSMGGFRYAERRACPDEDYDVRVECLAASACIVFVPTL